MDQTSRRYYDTLRLTDRRRLEVIRKLAEPRHQSVGRDDRGDQRLAYNGRPALVNMHHPGGSAITYAVWPRDLSNTGMGFLHGSFCYDDTRLEVMLRANNGGQVNVPARVVRCQLLKGTVHEIGIQFDHPINVHDFVDLGLTRSTDESDGSDALPRLNGRVLTLTHSEDDRQLIQFVGRGVGLKVSPATNGDEAERLLNENDFDLMLIDAALPCDARLIAETIRQAHPNLPILAVSADPEDARDDQWRAAGFAEVIIKPFDYQQFVAVLTRYLSRDHWTQPEQSTLVSDHWSNPQMRPLILGYLERMETRLGDLRKQVMTGSDTALDVLRDMKGSAGGYGYPRISESAEKLLNLLDSEDAAADNDDPGGSTQPPEQVRTALDELEALATAACRLRRKGA